MIPITRADGLLIALILTGLPLLYGHFWTTGEGQGLQIVANGQPTRVLPLSDQRIRVQGRLGEAVIEIIGGRARFASAPCQNRVCITRGWLAHAGDMAACLPNQVSIQILGADRRFDAINF